MGLARAERALGLESTCVAFEESPYHFPADEFLWSESDGHFSREFKRWKLLYRAIREFDVIHFNYGHSIMPQRIPVDHPELRRRGWLRFLYGMYSGLLDSRDLAVFKRAGIHIAVTFQGDDARQADFCLRNFYTSPAHKVEPEYYGGMDHFKRHRIQQFAQHAGKIYSLNPDLLHVLPPRSEFLPYGCVDPKTLTPGGPPPGSGDKLTIVHAPSNRGVKGTEHVIDAVTRASEVTNNVELLLIEGCTHQHALEQYRRADIVIDQLTAGWYGGFAVEAMAMGKPVICYLRHNDLRFIPDRMRAELPIIQASTESLYRVLLDYSTTRPGELAMIGAKSRCFAERWHNPREIAQRCKSDYESMTAPRHRAA